MEKFVFRCWYSEFLKGLLSSQNMEKRMLLSARRPMWLLRWKFTFLTYFSPVKLHVTSVCITVKVLSVRGDKGKKQAPRVTIAVVDDIAICC